MTDSEYDLFQRKEYYRGIINYESILATHISKMAAFRDTQPTKYCSSVETFILMCPKEIRQKGLDRLSQLGLIRNSYKEAGEDKINKYDELWIYINELLESENMIFKTGSFEIGHD